MPSTPFSTYDLGSVDIGTTDIKNLSCSPGHPSIGVDVERSNGPCEQRCCLIQPDLHIGTGIPHRFSILVSPIVP